MTRGCNAAGTEGLFEPEHQTLPDLYLYDHASLTWPGFISITADWLPLHAREGATNNSLVSYLMGSTPLSLSHKFQTTSKGTCCLGWDQVPLPRLVTFGWGDVVVQQL